MMDALWGPLMVLVAIVVFLVWSRFWWGMVGDQVRRDVRRHEREDLERLVDQLRREGHSG